MSNIVINQTENGQHGIEKIKNTVSKGSIKHVKKTICVD